MFTRTTKRNIKIAARLRTISPLNCVQKFQFQAFKFERSHSSVQVQAYQLVIVVMEKSCLLPTPCFRKALRLHRQRRTNAALPKLRFAMLILRSVYQYTAGAWSACQPLCGRVLKADPSVGAHLKRPVDGRRMRCCASNRSSQAVSSFSQMTDDSYTFTTFRDLRMAYASVIGRRLARSNHSTAQNSTRVFLVDGLLQRVP